jgi:EAL domain-containing protein (putative c-di-GMP-specific phosphodiesterase class I)/CheY-like chemotaxis protein
MERANRLLMIDDELAICEFVGAVARKVGFEFRYAADAEEFRRLVREFAPTALVLDLNMPQVDGIELLRFLADARCKVPILVISGENARVLAATERLGTAHGLRMADALQKPILLPVLRAALEKVMKQTVTADNLREAIGTGELLLHYQPKFALCGAGEWQIEGAEALMRWRHAELGTLMPADFIPLAAQSGLSRPITDLALCEAVEQLGRWRDRGLVLNIAVNISPDLLTDVEFPDRLSRLLKQHDVEGSCLTLEVTEAATMGDPDTAMDILARLRLKGVQIAIDDFGTGYSSLKQLFYMPFSELKIDGSFIMEVVTSKEARTMVRTMIQMAHNLNLKVCAEAVQSREALDFLEAEGCDKVQGYFFSEPISAVDFENFVRTWPGGSVPQARSNTNTNTNTKVVEEAQRVQKDGVR